MKEWGPWRREDNGTRFRIRGRADRPEADTGRLMFQSAMPHKQLYRVAGPPFPTWPTPDVATERCRALSADHEPTATAFLATFRHPEASLRDECHLEPDTAAAGFRRAREYAEPGPACGCETGHEYAPEGTGEPAQAPALDGARDHAIHVATDMGARDALTDPRRQDLLAL